MSKFTEFYASISPKVKAAFYGFAATEALIGLGYLQTDAGKALYAHAPAIVVLLISTAIPSLIGGLSGYLKRDPLRDVGAELVDPVDDSEGYDEQDVVEHGELDEDLTDPELVDEPDADEPESSTPEGYEPKHALIDGEPVEYRP